MIREIRVPVEGRIHTGREFGLNYDYEVNYRDLRKHFAERNRGDWLLLRVSP